MDNIINYLKDHPETGRRTLAKKFNISESKARFIVKQFKQSILKDLDNDDLIQYTIDKELSNQKLRDDLRITKKVRDEYRVSNYLKEMTTELINCYKDYKPQIIKHQAFNEDSNKKNPIGLLQLSDTHFNEIIDIPKNKYDFNIASKRCKKFIDESIFHFKNNNVKKVIFCMTGDLINSDRRPDEKMSMITSRARACYIASLIIEQMILDLYKHFDIKIGFVVGNESRSFEIGKSDIILSDNYDLTIVNMLKLMFRNTDIEFIPSNLIECILNIKNKNILLIHGESFLKKNVDKNILDLVAKHARNNIRIDYVICGHIHETCITDFWARSASLAGGNGYSNYDLNLSSRASQNIYIIDDWINGMKIDLQNVDNINGYTIHEDLLNKLNRNQNKMNMYVTKI